MGETTPPTTYDTRQLVVGTIPKGVLIDGETDRSRRQQRGSHVQGRHLLKHALGVVLGRHRHEIIGTRDIEKAKQKGIGRGFGDAEIELFENVGFHVEDLLSGVGAVGDVDTVANQRWIDFFVFGGNQESRDAYQLEATASDLDKAEVAIDDIDSEIERLGGEKELAMHVDEPIDENRSHDLVELGLPTHVRFGVRFGLLFGT